MATGLYSGAAQAVHKIPNRQPFSNDLGSVFLPTRIDDDHAFGNEDRRERNVCCDRNVALRGVVGDVLIGHIGSTLDAHGRQKAIAKWQGKTLIGNQYRLELESLRSTEADLLHIAWRCVRVHPKRERQSHPSFDANQTGATLKVCAEETCGELRPGATRTVAIGREYLVM